MVKENTSDIPLEELDFLTQILLEGQELEINFSSYQRRNFRVTGTLKIKEQDILVILDQIDNSPRVW